jgi:hypothetical protein
MGRASAYYTFVLENFGTKSRLKALFRIISGVYAYYGTELLKFFFN